MSKVITKDGQKYYPADCCFCGKEFFAAASIFQLAFGILDLGRGTCPHCNQEQQLTFVPDKEIMIAKERSNDNGNSKA